MDFDGPLVGFELIRSLHNSGMEWLSHHLDFVHKSGLSPTSTASRAHRRISEILQAMQQVDQLNIPVLESGERLCRFLVEIEVAVGRNPRIPDFQDLEAISGSTITGMGALSLPQYSKHVAQAQREEAFALQQRRKWAEEQRSQPSRSSDQPQQPKGPKKGPKGKAEGKKKPEE